MRLILDLEDSVSAEKKPEARAAVAAWLKDGTRPALLRPGQSARRRARPRPI
jgi:citrate lyase beta subunit